MAMLYYSLKTEINLKLQNYRFYLSGAFIAFLVFIATPARSTKMYPMVINEYTGYYNSAFMGLYSAALTSFIFATFGIYLLIGRISEDYTSGVGQILASTHMKSKDYIVTRAFSHIVTLLSVDLVAIITAIIVQFYHGEDLSFNLIDYLLPHIIFVWPISILVAFIAVFLELYFRNRLQMVYVCYFMIVTPLVSSLMIAGIDLFGFFAFGLYLHDAGLISSITDISLINGGDFTPIFVDFPGMTLTYQILKISLFILAIAVIFLLASVVRFDRFDPSKWSMSLTSMLQKEKREEVHDIPEQVEPKIVHYNQIPGVSRSSNWQQYLILIKAEFDMTMVRSKFYYFVLAIISIIAISEPSPVMITFTLFLAVFPVKHLFTKDFNQGSAELLLTMPQAGKKVTIVRLIVSMIMLVLVNGGLVFNYLAAGNLVRLALLGLTLFFVTTLAFGLSSFFRQDKAFISVFAIWWYLAINEMPGTDFLFVTISSANVIVYSILSVAFLALGLIANWLHR